MKKQKKVKNDKALKKTNADKEGLWKKFIKVIKQKWLIKGTTTIALIAILIAAFVLINMGVKKLNITAIDCTANKTNTLSDESKNRIKDIDKEVKLNFVGYQESDEAYTLAKQYNKVNSNIKLEMVDVNENLEFANKYNLTADSQYVIVVESGDTSRTISQDELYTYNEDYSGTVDLTEQKITSAILNVTTTNVPKMYFLTGYTTFSFEQQGGLYYLANQYLADEVLTYDTLDLLAKKEVPDDCNTLVIATPDKDFDKVVSDAIIKYIKKGGNILWLNGVYTKDLKLTNVNKVLAEYGINPFDVGFIYETDSGNIMGYDTCFKPVEGTSKITNDLKKGVLYFNSTKININTDKLSELNVEETDIITSADTTYFSTNLTGTRDKKKDKKGSYVLGALLEKKVSKDDEEEKKSRLIIYGNDYFVSDLQLVDGMYPMVYQYNNSDLFLNSLAYLNNKDEDITIRKNYANTATTFSATEGQINMIIKIIFIVPVAIIAAGIIVWIIRKNKK